MKFSKLLTISILLTGVSAFAGKVGGNGGFVCSQAETGKYITLDQSEAKDLYNMTEDLGDVSTDYRIKIETVIYRLSRLDIFRAYRIKAYFNAAFSKESDFLVEANELDEVISAPDIETFPFNCENMVQAASQSKTKNGKVIYKIRKDLWANMDNNAKASLILHEIIYTEALGLSHSGSMKTRFLIGLLCSSQLTHLSVSQYYNFMKLIGMGSGSAIPIGIKPPVENGD